MVLKHEAAGHKPIDQIVASADLIHPLTLPAAKEVVMALADSFVQRRLIGRSVRALPAGRMDGWLARLAYRQVV